MKRAFSVALFLFLLCMVSVTAHAQEEEHTHLLPESCIIYEETQGSGLTAKSCTKVRPANYTKTEYLGYSYPIQCRKWWKGSCGDAYITDLTPEIAYFKDGCIWPQKVGTAKFRLTCDNAKYTFSITCKYRKGTSVTLSSYSAEVQLGNTMTLYSTVQPSAYADQTCTYSSSNTKIATVSKTGVITGKKEGTCVITVKSKTKNIQAKCSVYVYDSVRRRAVVIGEYSGTKGTDSSATAKEVEKKSTQVDVNGMAALFIKYNCNPVRIIENASSWSSIESMIRNAFSGADSDDISYLYIHAHGGIQNTASRDYYIAIASGTYDYICTATQLKNLLDSIPGKKVVILESCHCGQIIGKSEDGTEYDYDEALQAFANCFALSSKATTLTTGSYCVFCAAHSSTESRMFMNYNMCGKKKFTAGLFTFWFAKGAGWDVVSKKACTASADANKNNSITVAELFNYVDKNVESTKKTLWKKYKLYNVVQCTAAYQGFSDPIFVKK